MPSKSPKQARFMAACSHGSNYPSCPPSNVSKEFNNADRGGKLLQRAAKQHLPPKGGYMAGKTYHKGT